MAFSFGIKDPILINMMIERFNSTKSLIGASQLERRKQARIAVIGLGGVGSWAAEALARSGVGEILLADLDDICLSNINRQLHTLQSTAGMQKTETMRKRLLDINPDLKIRIIDDFITKENVENYLIDIDVVIDCVDGVSAKCSLISHCRKHQIQVITTGGAAAKLNPLQIMVKDLARSYNDPLLQRVRKKLRNDYSFPTHKKELFGITAIFSPEEMLVQNNPVHEDADLPKTCSGGLGTCVTVTATFGLYAAYCALEMLRKES